MRFWTPARLAVHSTTVSGLLAMRPARPLGTLGQSMFNCCCSRLTPLLNSSYNRRVVKGSCYEVVSVFRGITNSPPDNNPDLLGYLEPTPSWAMSVVVQKMNDPAGNILIREGVWSNEQVATFARSYKKLPALMKTATADTSSMIIDGFCVDNVASGEFPLYCCTVRPRRS